MDFARDTWVGKKRTKGLARKGKGKKGWQEKGLARKGQKGLARKGELQQFPKLLGKGTGNFLGTGNQKENCGQTIPKRGSRSHSTPALPLPRLMALTDDDASSPRGSVPCRMALADDDDDDGDDDRAVAAGWVSADTAAPLMAQPTL